MRQIVTFTLIANAIAGALLALCYWLIPAMSSVKPVDALFLTGIFFWCVSTIMRLSTKRVKKEWNRNEVIITDPQLVMHASSWAFRFLIAGIPGIVASIALGTLIY
ncbi:hypothetical protein [Reinekea marinisedimentorum]|uniref:Uncharacterized protein n=1 Tax=Reinekea marinisedimentorum TaxID=230495 RepID=A0A4R3I2M1_9GAMM|nr:hypothetical protein [Reinekea marinisedimentorum]TCS38149.1 hypothetical protein BCF53_11777 [Reinekea marinisedimentorum]